MKKIEEYLRTIPDFPKPGIMFRDVTSVIQDSDGFRLAIDSMDELLKDNAALFAGGDLSQEQKDAFFEAVMKAYITCKEEAKIKFGSKNNG